MIDDILMKRYNMYVCLYLLVALGSNCFYMCKNDILKEQKRNRKRERGGEKEKGMRKEREKRNIHSELINFRAYFIRNNYVIRVLIIMMTSVWNQHYDIDIQKKVSYSILPVCFHKMTRIITFNRSCTRVYTNTILPNWRERIRNNEKKKMVLKFIIYI